MLRRRNLLLLILLIVCENLSAQPAPGLPADSVQLTLRDAENLFLQKNFLLLAAKYQVSAADASVIQARLWSNPMLNFEQGAYNPNTGQWFDMSKTGEMTASLQQLILLGGKRSKQVDMAKLNSQIAQFQFYDLMRTLRYQLRSSFYSLYYTRQSIAVYDKELESLQTLIDAYTEQYNKGNIAFKELARLQALHFSLSNERIDLLKDAAEKQGNIALLCGDTLSRAVIPVLDAASVSTFNTGNITYRQLVDSALMHRYDLQAAHTQVSMSMTNLSLQKAYRVPDVTLAANYDKAGNYINNYNSLSIYFPIPLLNRNKGNIRNAEFMVDASNQQLLQAEAQVKTDINKAFAQLLETDNLYKSASKQFNPDYDKLLDGITKGYESRTISLLEFIDYYETYKNSKIEFNRLQNNRLDALENLNLATGSKILN